MGEAVLQCVTAAAASELLRSSIELPDDCDFEPEDHLEGTRGQLLQEKLDQECDQACQDFGKNITRVADQVDKVYSQKQVAVDVTIQLQKGFVAIARLAQAGKEYRGIEFEKEDLRTKLTDKIKKNKVL